MSEETPPNQEGQSRDADERIPFETCKMLCLHAKPRKVIARPGELAARLNTGRQAQR